MRLLVSGSREFDTHEDYLFIWRLLIDKNLEEPYLSVVHGDCPRGADYFAKIICEVGGINQERFPADWNKHGKAAGHIRNQQMVDTRPDEAWFFPRGISRGTWDCFQRVEKAGIPYVIFGEFEQRP